MNKRVRAISSSIVANCLEFYDFFLFGAFATIISDTFFPPDDQYKLVKAFIAYGAGLYVRPLGALYFGYLGDKYGRKRSLISSILLMSFPTALISILPGYSVLGPLSPIFLFLCRAIQGFSAGGEYNGSAIFSIEHAGKKHKALAGTLVSSAGTIGGFLATNIASVIYGFEVVGEKWRFAFVLSALLAGVGYYIRRKVTETDEFNTIQKEKQVLDLPLKEAILKYPKSIFVCFLGGSVSSILGSTFIAYIPNYIMNVLKMPHSLSLRLGTVGTFAYIVLAPVAGYFADRFNLKRVMVIGSIGLILGGYFAFYLIHTGTLQNIILGQMLITVFSAFFIAPMNLLMNLLFPANVRFSGVAFGYAFGKAFGGNANWIYTYLIISSGYVLAPGFGVIFAGILSAFVVILGTRIIKQQKHTS